MDRRQSRKWIGGSQGNGLEAVKEMDRRKARYFTKKILHMGGDLISGRVRIVAPKLIKSTATATATDTAMPTATAIATEPQQNF